jgi:hypothetical protein
MVIGLEVQGKIFMDIVRFKGGLGNQMFQYALMESLRSRGREVRGSIGFYDRHPNLMPFTLDKVFQNIDLNLVNESEFVKIDNEWKKVKVDEEHLKNFKDDGKNRFFWVEETDGVYTPGIFQTQNCAFVGYWQSWKYFENISDTLMECYRFGMCEDKLKSLGEMLENNYVSVHVRRGDYLQPLYENICTSYYYGKALQIMSEMICGVKFVFMSDDKEWVESNFNIKDMIIVSEDMFEDYQDWYDMYLMTKCRGNIIANSSFSWWGAWLNGNTNKIVIAPDKWINGKDTPDIWCDDWIRI